MATPAKTIRVQDLAKEIGVPTKQILERCKAEGIEGLTSNQSGVKLGLVATIREWFSGENAAPATEAPAAKPKPEVAAKTPKPKAAKAEAPAAENLPAAPKKAVRKAQAAAPLEAAPPVAAPPAPAPKAPAAVEAPVPTAAPTPAPAAAAPDAPEVAPAPAKPAAPQVATVHPPRPAIPLPPARPRPLPAGVQNVPTRPTGVKQMGEAMPAPVKRVLRGPQVIRIEAPENIPAPRSRPRPGEGNGNGSSGTGDRRSGTATGGAAGGGIRTSSTANAAGVSRSTGPVRGGGVKPKTVGTGNTPAEDEKNKRRSLSARRGRSDGAVLTGATKFSQADLDDLDARLKGASTTMRNRRKQLGRGHFQAQSPADVGGKVSIEEPITIKALSAATGIKAAACVKFLFKKGIMATVNSAIDTEAAMEIAMEHDIELEVKAHQTASAKVEQEFANRDRTNVLPRPPVVTILGHVDHGKTSLLDRIRKADVAAHEDGGITQHVGAYRVTVEGSDGEPKTVVFLDTPGHAAFTSMRARGAKVTDVVVLLVAAEDGLMPQTIESIAHAKAAKVPVVVALNKIDMVPPQHRDALLQRIYGELAQHGLNASAWGGETEVCMVSAKTGEGIPELLEILELQAGVLGLTADFAGPARGTVIESEMQAGRGAVARVLVQEGNIRVGDFFVAGRSFGRVRGLTDDRGRRLQEAGPATPVEVSGIDEVPDAGDKFYVTDSLRKAEEIAGQCREDERNQQLARETKVTLDNFSATLKAGQTKTLNLVLKADVQGSVETLKKTLEEIGNDEVRLRVLHMGVGVITESDILLADASDAVVLGFHVPISPQVRDIAEARHVEVRSYRVIYELLDDMKAALEGMLAPDVREEEIGRAEVKEVFRIGKVGAVAGCIVASGSAVKKDVKVRLLRDNAIVTEKRNVETLRRHKDEVSEVRAGTECAIRLAGFEDVKNGDVIVFYKVIETARKLA